MIKPEMQAILEKIEAYERIMLFRHTRPDGDCVGATKGMQALLQASYPEKEILIVDEAKSDYLAFMGPDTPFVEDDVYASVLAIVIDTANQDRISNQKYALCAEVIKIDHHIEREPYGCINWVEDWRSSACEMIAAFAEAFSDRLTLNRQAATCIYTGMVTDSGRFQYEGVTGDTLRLAGMLLDQGIDTETLYANLYLRDFDDLKFKAYCYEHMERTENGVAWLYISREMQEEFGLTFETASTAIGYLDGIRGSLCWLAFIDAGDEEIRVRLRSRFMTVNQIAEQYHGGGHACASGATVYSREEMQALLADADAAIKQYKETHEGWL